MNGELIAGRTTTAKRGNSTPYRSDCEMEYDRCPADHYNRVFDCQRVPSSSPVKRRRPSSSSSSSSSWSSAALRMKSTRASSSSHRKLKMAELLSIKRELTAIKVQIDGLLDCVDKMDAQRTDWSVSSLERESPEPGEASEEETLHSCPPGVNMMKPFESGLQDDL
ncbi:heterogeneous nuclear ribonucleoprotein C-like [Pseudochaenichthys georgianus]|uniref:heterogeneous nuclear ribonucleoprotein C-like n=1 Tax=Pseudochaenichthys georgianus TaxID=52239 RepID=UPI0039C38C15